MLSSASLQLESGSPLTVFAVRDGPTAKELDPLMWKPMGNILPERSTLGWEKNLRHGAAR